MSAVLKFQSELVTHICIACGIQFAFPQEFENRRRETHESFYCPNGHSACWRGETEAERLRKQLDVEQRRTRMASEQAAMERAERLKAERKLKRVDKGVCPKCNRSFADLARHMQNKHAPKCKGAAK